MEKEHYPDPINYLGFTIVLCVLSGLIYDPVYYYPVIYKNGTWIHEFGCSWIDKEKAYFEAIGFINILCRH